MGLQHLLEFMVSYTTNQKCVLRNGGGIVEVALNYVKAYQIYLNVKHGDIGANHTAPISLSNKKGLPAFIKCSKPDYLIIGFINFLSFPSFSFCLQSSGIPEESSLKTYFNQSRKISIDRICTWFCCGRYQKLHSLMFGGVGVVNN